MLNTNWEIYVIFQSRAGDKIKPQMQEYPAQIGRVGMSAISMIVATLQQQIKINSDAWDAW